MTQSRQKSSSSPRQEKQTPTTEAIPIAQIKVQNGIPHLLVGGTPTPPLFVDIVGRTTEAKIRSCTEAGITLFRLAGVSLGWTGPGKFDPENLDTRVRALLAAAPEARFLLELVVDAPVWWRNANPAEAAVYCLPPAPENAENEETCASWASRKWLNETGEAITRLFRYVGRQPWAERCVAVQIAAGTEGEWRHPEAQRLPDIGPRMTEFFRNTMLEKYRRNGGLLRKAWFDTRIDFTAIVCPNARERQMTNQGIFRKPSRSRYLLDYYEAFFTAQNTAALHFCHMARNATEGKVLVGLAFARAFGTEALSEDGHRFPEAVLDSPDVDFLVSVGLPEEKSFLLDLNGSLGLREKLVLHVPGPAQPARLAAALAMTQSAGVILPTDVRAEDLAPIARAMVRTQKQAGHTRKTYPQIAVIVDPANSLTTYFRGAPSNWLNEALLTAQIHELAGCGVPFAVHLLSDLFQPKFPEYKVVIFLNCFYLSEAERRQVDARIKRSDKTAVWLWAPGIVAEDGIDARFCEQLCGIKLRMEGDETNLRVRIADSNTPMTWGTHIGTTFGVDRPLAPTLTVTDKAIVRLGANTGNKTNFALKKFDTWTSVLFGAAPVPTLLLRNVLRAAGCHLYLEADGVASAGAQALAISSGQGGGTLKISLPGAFDVVDAWTGASTAQGATEFTVKHAPAEVGYYTLRPRRESRSSA